MTGRLAKRTALAERLADRLLSEGVEQATLKSLAAALGTSDRMLLYYFTDKADLMTAALQVLVARILGMMDDVPLEPSIGAEAAATRLIEAMLSDAARPYGRLWLEIVARAGRHDPLYAPIGQQIAVGLLEWTQAKLGADSDALAVLRKVEGAVLLDAVGLR